MVATGAKPVTFLRLQVLIWTLLFLSWGWQALTEGKRVQVFMTVLAGIALAGYVWMAVSTRRVELVVHEDHLQLSRRFRSLSIARSDITAIRGDVPGRPTWSQQVLIETDDRTVRLPALDRSPSETIARLQEWAGVGEQPTA